MRKAAALAGVTLAAGRTGSGRGGREAAGAAPAGIIALDLDGTLLNSAKELSEGNRAALQKAAGAGWEIVPTTGRFYGGMPEVIRQLPFVRYVITINGAAVMKVDKADEEDCSVQTATAGEPALQSLYRAEIPWQQAQKIMAWLDEKPVIYDCYMDNAAWMSQALKARVDEIIEDSKIRKMFHDLRHPVPDLKSFLSEYCPAGGVRGEGSCGINVQKIQFFTKDMELRARLLTEIPQVFPGIVATSSSPQNIELNQTNANKGQALLALADALGVRHEKTIAFGDGLNDVSMLRAAGIGIAMDNAEDEIKKAADWVTASCDEDGVAIGIKRFVLSL